METYQTRPIRFLEIYDCEGWQVKIYSISTKSEFVSDEQLGLAKGQLPNWLQKSNTTALETYRIATFIVHEAKEGCFAVLSWWIDENMLQLFAYLRLYGAPDFKLYSGNGIVCCVWEMAVLCFERTAWTEYVLKRHGNPDFKTYLQQQLHTDI
jgi:hypothetical protein